MVSDNVGMMELPTVGFALRLSCFMLDATWSRGCFEVTCVFSCFAVVLALSWLLLLLQLLLLLVQLSQHGKTDYQRT